MKRYFITGIGTEVGKTVAAAVLTEALGADYWKPVQAGDLHHSDTHKVQALVSGTGTTCHPEAYRLTHPMSPHAAAERDGVRIELAEIQVPETDNKLVIEGAGGLLVPLNDKDLIADLIPSFSATVVLVVRHYLGSINHSLLSIKYLQSVGVEDAVVLWNGTPNPDSEAAILAHCPYPVLGRIAEAVELTPEFIQQEAEKLRASL